MSAIASALEHACIGPSSTGVKPSSGHCKAWARSHGVTVQGVAPGALIVALTVVGFAVPNTVTV
jgi:hypothetical protein